MKVVFLLPRTRRSGLVNVMELLAAELGAPVIHLDQGQGYSLARFVDIWRELRRMKRLGVRVHSSGFFPDLMNACSGRHLASTTLHGYLGPEYALLYGPVRGRVLAALHATTARVLPLRLACSQSVERWLRARYRLETRTCLNGCRSRAMPSASPAPIDDERTYYFAGPFIARKGVVAAVAAVLENDPSASFRAFGAGPEQEKLDRLKERGARLFTGTVPDPTAHYRSGQFYMSFSRFEGMPLGAIEALRCGCIPVLSSIPPHHELLELLGEPGLQCFETPAEGVTWARQLRGSERASLAQAVRVRAEALFAGDAFAARFRDAIAGAAAATR